MDDLAKLVEGILAGNRAILARAITLVESESATHRELARELVDSIFPHAGGSRRIGITGIPGVGKSTLIDALGVHLIREHGDSVAVLSLDPTSPESRGSILADKTRMEKLSRETLAFIRPSPVGQELGGVRRSTRETLWLCEAAGFKNILVETVGTGQSEMDVRNMTDLLVLLLHPGAGDQLQAIKRGVTEMADIILVNKADGSHRELAQQTYSDYQHAGLKAEVLLCSALEQAGIDEVWNEMAKLHQAMQSTSALQQTRREQIAAWTEQLIDHDVRSWLNALPAFRTKKAELLEQVKQQQLSPASAARQLLDSLRHL